MIRSLLTRSRGSPQPPGKRLIVATEGKVTERRYVSSLRARFRIPNEAIDIVRHDSTDPLGIVRALGAEVHKQKSAKKFQVNAGDQAWAIFDVDEHRQVNEENFTKALALGQKIGAHFALSNPSFELWILLHFRYHSANIDRHTAVREVRKHLPDYDKTLPHDEAQKLASLVDTAIRYSVQLEKRNKEPGRRECSWPNPCTYFHEFTQIVQTMAPALDS